MEKNIRLLAIESSCDETAAAVVENGRKVLSSVVASQVERHVIYGGVVPEVASRLHAESISQVVAQALEQEAVEVTDVTLTQEGERAEIAVFLRWQGEDLSVRVPVEGG